MDINIDRYLFINNDFDEIVRVQNLEPLPVQLIDVSDFLVDIIF